MGKYLVLDFDDVIINNRAILNEEVEKIDHRATSEYEKMKHKDYQDRERELSDKIQNLVLQLMVLDAKMKQFITEHEDKIRRQVEFQNGSKDYVLTLIDKVNKIDTYLKVVLASLDLNDLKLKDLINERPLNLEKIGEIISNKETIVKQRDHLIKDREELINKILKLRNDNSKLIRDLGYKELYNKYIYSVGKINHAIEIFRQNRSIENKKQIKKFKIEKDNIFNQIINSSMMDELKSLIIEYDHVLMKTFVMDVRLDELRENHKIEKSEFYDLKDRILEEVDDQYKGKIDYDRVLDEKILFNSRNIDYINSLIRNGSFDQVFIGSHFNSPREVETKRRIIERYFPGVIFIPIPFHLDKYKPGLFRNRTSKAKYILDYLRKNGYAEEHGIKDLNDFVLIDDSEGNIKDFEKNGGQGIVYDYKSPEEMQRWLEESKYSKEEATRYHEFLTHKLHDLNPINVGVMITDRYIHLPEPEDIKKR